MVEHILGEIALLPYDFTPKGYLRCDGQMLQAADFPELCSLLGKKFGGDGVKTFALPDYRNRIQAKYGSESLAYYIAVETVEGEVPREGDVPGKARDMGQIALFAFELKDWGPAWIPADGRSIGSREALYSLLQKTPNLAGSAPAGSQYAMVRLGMYPRSSDEVDLVPWALTGEIRLLPYDFEPPGWVECGDDRKLPIAPLTPLFALLRERFGPATYPMFNVPDLTNSAPAGLRYCICLKGSHPQE